MPMHGTHVWKSIILKAFRTHWAVLFRETRKKWIHWNLIKTDPGRLSRWKKSRRSALLRLSRRIDMAQSNWPLWEPLNCWNQHHSPRLLPIITEECWKLIAYQDFSRINCSPIPFRVLQLWTVVNRIGRPESETEDTEGLRWNISLSSSLSSWAATTVRIFISCR